MSDTVKKLDEANEKIKEVNNISKEALSLIGKETNNTPLDTALNLLAQVKAGSVCPMCRGKRGAIPDTLPSSKFELCPDCYDGSLESYLRKQLAEKDRIIKSEYQVKLGLFEGIAKRTRQIASQRAIIDSLQWANNRFAEAEKKQNDFSSCGELKTAVAKAKVSADNSNYLCAVTIKQAEDAIVTIEKLQAENDRLKNLIAENKAQFLKYKGFAENCFDTYTGEGGSFAKGE